MGAIAAYFLLSEHRAHFLGVLPLLLLLSCPLIHLFMHHDHGGHGGGQSHHHGGEHDASTTAAPTILKSGDRP